MELFGCRKKRKNNTAQILNLLVGKLLSAVPYNAHNNPLEMIRGTSIEQDSRFKDKTKQMLQESTWPDKYDKKINLKKVRLRSC